jgi:hypothetical protein
LRKGCEAQVRVGEEEEKVDRKVSSRFNQAGWLVTQNERWGCMIKDRVVGVRRRTLIIVVALAAPLVSLGVVAPVLAESPAGAFAVFSQCPRFAPGVNFCIYGRIEHGGEIIGKGGLSIVNPITFQGGYERNEEKEPVTERFVGAIDGETISRTPQPIPGGLASLIDCDEIHGRWFPNRVLRRACKAVLESSSSTGVNATAELAGPAGDIAISSDNLINEEGVALSLPVKIHLENPFLGRDCYIGSNRSPITLNLTDGATSPPLPNEPISGELGHVDQLTFEGFNYIEVTNNVQVDNSFAVPAVSGCGGPFSSVMDRIIDAKLGLPSPAGYNTIIHNGTFRVVTAEDIIKSEKRENKEETPPGKRRHRDDPHHWWH